jgi:uncharacterized protein
MAGLVLALLVPVAISALRDDPDPLTTQYVFISFSYKWLIVVALCMLVLYWERLPLRSIGLKPAHAKDFAWGLCGFLLGILAFAAVTPLVSALGLGSAEAGVGEIAKLPVYVAVFMAITAGITEEIVFRGYAIERLAVLTGNAKIGAALAYIIFVALHAPGWGAGGTLQIGAWSLVVTGLYLWKRSLMPCIVMHVLNDLFAFVLIPALYRFS